MILNEYVEIIGNSRNLKHFKERGYDIEVNKKIIVKVNDLSNGSTFKVNIACDICFSEKKITWSSYYKYKENDENKKYHCRECSIHKRIKTNLKRYGGKSPTNSKEVVDKIKKTNFEKYGNNSSLHGNRQSIIEDIFIEKYGYKTPLLNEDIKDNIRLKLLENFGVDSPLKSKEILNKLKKTNLERYGVDNPSKSNFIINKIKSTNLEKWGEEWYYQSEDFKEKRNKTIIEKYGVIDYFKSNHRNKYVLDNKIINYPDLNIISYNDRVFNINCEKCENNFDITTDLLYKRNKENREICTKCNTLNSKFRSNGEIQICDFLKEQNINFNVSVRNIIKGELDIYLPDYKIAIEYNGIFWHSEFFKDKKYHNIKYNSCKDLNINLIQIWEDQWLENPEKVKSYILNKLKIYKYKIWARNCKIKYVNYKEKDIFLNDNHLQKTSRSSTNIGLYYNNELISIMTFGKRKLNSKDNFELIRYCSKRDHIIIGGVSKLFNFFKRNHKFESIISYSDNTVSDGDIYNFLKFKKTNESLNYYWCDGKERYHRFTFNKKRLIKQGYDKNKSGYQIMREIGFYRIFGAGIKTWIYEN